MGDGMTEENVDRNIEISLKRYQDLLDSEAWLMALEAAGVDNWEGIDFAYELKEDNSI